MTPENGSAIVSNDNISQPESKVKSNTSNLQTTAKKSKGMTADAVYEKGKKFKVGDKVGEVTLVADDTGTPVTPVLRASFDRTDIPSYIMATVEASGDIALTSALEEENAYMVLSGMTGGQA